MITDSIADMFTQIRNGQAVQKEAVWIPFSKLRLNIARLLQKEEFLKEVKSKGKDCNRRIGLVLNYDDKNRPAIHSLERISKPGRRIYRSAHDIKSYKAGRGIVVVSTPRGLMTGQEARKNNLGGELIGKLW